MEETMMEGKRVEIIYIYTRIMPFSFQISTRTTHTTFFYYFFLNDLIIIIYIVKKRKQTKEEV